MAEPLPNEDEFRHINLEEGKKTTKKGGGGGNGDCEDVIEAEENEEDSIAALIVGHYCHDTLRLREPASSPPSPSSSTSSSLREALGGSVSYITNVFDALGLRSCVVSKVGSDFAYFGHVRGYTPKVIPSCPTTCFSADFTLGHPRVLHARHICEPIFPHDIPPLLATTFRPGWKKKSHYHLGLAVGVAGEILPETLVQMGSVCEHLIVDAQALLRTIDPSSCLVGLQRLELTPFYRHLDKISYLKASSEEAVFLDIEDVRKKTSLIVTQGGLGCTIYTKDSEISVPAFRAIEIDPTGAGDSFLAGFSAGLQRGLSTEEAASMGNYFGGLTIAQVGVPQFTCQHLQNLPKTRNGQLLEGVSSLNGDCDTEFR